MRWLGFILCGVLMGCAVLGGVPTPHVLPSIAPQWFTLERQEAEQNQPFLLAVEPIENGIRFVQTDALGAPIARQIVNEQAWQNDGFIAPNAESRRLFAAILSQLGRDEHAIYPQLMRQKTANEQSETVRDSQQELWKITRENNELMIEFPNQIRWRVRPMESVEESS